MVCSFLWELCPQMCTWCANWPHYTFSFTCQCRGIPCCRRSVNVLRGYVRWAGGSNQPLYRPLYALGLDACLFTGMLNCNEAYLHKLVAAWIIMLLAFSISHVSWLWATSMNEFIWWLWKCNGNSWWRFWCNSLLGILSRLLNTYLHTHYLKSWWTQWEVWQLVTATLDEGGQLLCEWDSQGYDCTDSCHVWPELTWWLPSKWCCCEAFFAILQRCCGCAWQL
jgi:hypothetical protein